MVKNFQIMLKYFIDKRLEFCANSLIKDNALINKEVL